MVFYSTCLYQPQFIRKDDLNIPIKTINWSQSGYAISHISIIAGSAAQLKADLRKDKGTL